MTSNRRRSLQDRNRFLGIIRSNSGSKALRESKYEYRFAEYEHEYERCAEPESVVERNVDNNAVRAEIGLIPLSSVATTPQTIA